MVAGSNTHRRARLHRHSFTPFMADRCSAVVCSSCALCVCACSNGGGKGLIAMQVFAFIGLTAVLFMTTVRILGASVSFLEPTRKVNVHVEWRHAWWLAWLWSSAFGASRSHARKVNSKRAILL